MQSPAKNSTYKIQRHSFKLQNFKTSFLFRDTLFLKITYSLRSTSEKKIID